MGDPIECHPRRRGIYIVARWQQVGQIPRASLQRNHDVSKDTRKCGPVLCAVLATVVGRVIETLAWYVPKERTQRDLFYNRSFFELNLEDTAAELQWRVTAPAWRWQLLSASNS
jgi:hypothetical protein